MGQAGLYKPNDFTVITSAMDLADYVLKITSNLNKFPDIRSTEENGTLTVVLSNESLVNWVRIQAKDIYMLAFTANRINLKLQPWRKEERLSKQARAIELCEEHFAAIQLCRKRFHLSNKRIRYWGKKVLTVERALEGWHNKDKIRYKNI